MAIGLHQHIDTILSSAFSGEIDYILRPESKGYADTYAVWSIVGGESFQNLEGDIDLRKPRVQISVYAVNNSDLVTKVAAVNAAMLAAAVLAQTSDPGTTAGALYNYSASVPVDGYEEDTGYYYSHMDFYCWL